MPTSFTVYELMILFMILYTTPEGLTARILEDLPPVGAPVPGEGETTLEGSLSKGQIHSSQSRRDGSATGDDSPSGSVQMSPPTTITNLTFDSSNSSSPNGSSSFTHKTVVTTTNDSSSTPTSKSTFNSVKNTTVTQQKTVSRGSSAFNTGDGGVGDQGSNIGQINFNLPPGFQGNVPLPLGFPQTPTFPSQP